VVRQTEYSSTGCWDGRGGEYTLDAFLLAEDVYERFQSRISSAAAK